VDSLGGSCACELSIYASNAMEWADNACRQNEKMKKLFVFSFVRLFVWSFGRLVLSVHLIRFRSLTSLTMTTEHAPLPGVSQFAFTNDLAVAMNRMEQAKLAGTMSVPSHSDMTDDDLQYMPVESERKEQSPQRVLYTQPQQKQTPSNEQLQQFQQCPFTTNTAYRTGMALIYTDNSLLQCLCFFSMQLHLLRLRVAHALPNAVSIANRMIWMDSWHKRWKLVACILVR
jgi:hypothetical protein